ncbi:hypothetical protein BKA65DRAFT_402190 [Rhexocercosporidium sp. MPI-PUGE-AT-0058]|nr:hypothetical protein BKA65DRAFT_402190 [Rhexocercosporidium sp. MPI-PUGE-AT-0058]
MYHQQETNEIHSSDGLLHKLDHFPLKTNHWSFTRHPLLLISLFINFLFFCTGFLHWVSYGKIVHHSYETGFALELDPVKPEIEIVQRTYGGEIQVDEDGNYFTDGRGDLYGGAPSPAVDDAWHSLLEGLNIGFTSSEVDLGNSTFKWPGSGDYFSGLEVFHSLHCLNRVREALYPEYYDNPEHPNNPSRRDHLEHCINHIREGIQCHSDLTPMEWYLAGNKIILKADTTHTCRNFNRIHDWAAQRKTVIYNEEDEKAMRSGSLFIVD